MSSQLELFSTEPFSLRIPIEDGMEVFRVNYWNHTDYGKTSNAVCRKILTFFKGHYLDSISGGDVERMRRFYKEMGYSDSYINKIHMTLSRMISWWFETKEGKYLNNADFSRVILPEKNPASLVPRVKENPRQTPMCKKIKELHCKVAETIMGDIDLSETLDTLWWSTLRITDLFEVVPEKVDLDKRTIRGIQSKSIRMKNPSGRPYFVIIPENRIEMIRRRVEAAGAGKPIFKDTNLQKRWKRLREITKTKHIKMMDYSGGAISELLDAGIDYETIRKKRGWADYEMIAWYDKRGDDRILKATEKLVEK